MKDIEPGACQASGVQGRGQGGLVDEVTACRVDQKGRRFHQAQCLGVATPRYAHLPVATNAIPRAKCYSPVRNTFEAGGAGSARISFQRPKRTLAQ